MALVSLQDVLVAARKLPRQTQTELAELLLREASETLAGELHAGATKTKPTLAPLSGLSVEELRALADAVLAPARQRRLKELLEKNREGKLTKVGRAELDELLVESDRVALVKAKATYTLFLQQKVTGGPA